MKRFVICIIFLLFILSAIIAVEYGPFEGSFSEDVLEEGSYIGTGDTFDVNLEVNVVVDNLPSIVKVGFVRSDTIFADNISSYLAMGNNDTTSDSILKKITISETNNRGEALSEQFKLFFGIISADTVELGIALQSPDGTSAKLIGTEYGKSLEWSASVNETTTVNSIEKASDVFFTHDPTIGMISKNLLPVSVAVNNYYEVPLDVYRGYLILKVSTT